VAQILILKRKKQIFSINKYSQLPPSDVEWLLWPCGSATWTANGHIIILDGEN